MNLIKIYNRSRALILTPFSEWNEISTENKIRREVILDLLLPASLLIGICSLLGTFFSEGIEDSFSISYLLFNGFISFMIIFLEVYLSGWLITEIAMSFEDKIDSHSIFNLVIYSHIPFFLTLAFTRLVPQLFFLNILGFYSFFLFWTGIEKFMELKDEKKIVFLILSMLIMLLLYLILTVVFNSIYEVVLNQFTTFDG